MRHRRRFVSVVACAALSLFPLGAAAVAAPAAVPLNQLTVSTTQLASGLQRPTAIAGLPDGRLLITEHQGTVRVYAPGTGLAAAPVLDLRSKVDTSDNERGLLGIVAAPNSTTVVYVAYTALPDSHVTLSRVTLGNPASEQVLLTFPHAAFGNHNGGQLAFGKDGFLYWSIGDGGSAGDPNGNGQSRNTLLGKILRLDVSQSCRPYCVPRDNPFVNMPNTRPEIWVYGARNPWRFSFDPSDGSLWIADVGQGTREEIDHIGMQAGGTNLGWSCREGTTVFNPARCDPAAHYTDPVFDYQSSVDGCAVIGGYVYRGQQFAAIAAGTYVASDYCSNVAWAVRANADGTHTSARIGEFPIQPTSFGTDSAGELYMVNDLPGRLYRVAFASTGG